MSVFTGLVQKHSYECFLVYFLSVLIELSIAIIKTPTSAKTDTITFDRPNAAKISHKT